MCRGQKDWNGNFPIAPRIPDQPTGPDNTNDDNGHYGTCTKLGGNNCKCNGKVRYGWKNNWSAWWKLHMVIPCRRHNKLADKKEKCMCKGGDAPNTTPGGWEKCKHIKDDDCSCTGWVRHGTDEDWGEIHKVDGKV